MSDAFDLDALVPEKLTVKLHGKIWEVQPLTVGDIVALTKTFKALNDAGEQADLSEFNSLLYRLIPALEKEGVSLTIPQMMALLEYVMTKTTGERPDIKKNQGPETSPAK